MLTVGKYRFDSASRRLPVRLTGPLANPGRIHHDLRFPPRLDSAFLYVFRVLGDHLAWLGIMALKPGSIGVWGFKSMKATGPSRRWNAVIILLECIPVPGGHRTTVWR